MTRSGSSGARIEKERPEPCATDIDIIVGLARHPASFARVLTLLLVPAALIVPKLILMARDLITPILVILSGVAGGTLGHGPAEGSPP